MAEMLLHCGDPLTDCLRIARPPINHGKDEQTKSDCFEGIPQIFVASQFPDLPVKCNVTIVKVLHVHRGHARTCHGRNESRQFLVRCRRKILGCLPDCDRLQRNADFLNEPIILRAELCDIGATLGKLAKKPLMSQLVQSFAQCRLADPETRSPFLLNNAVPPAQLPRDYGFANSLSGSLGSRLNPEMLVIWFSNTAFHIDTWPDFNFIL